MKKTTTSLAAGSLTNGLSEDGAVCQGRGWGREGRGWGRKEGGEGGSYRAKYCDQGPCHTGGDSVAIGI